VALTMAGEPAAVIAQSAMVGGIVKKVDEAAGKSTIQHGPLKKFDMEDGMAMVFQAKDPAMLKQVKIGDKMRFEPERVNGQLTVMKIERRNNSRSGLNCRSFVNST
jgi:Cu/Ag efflux protein CusF